MLKVMIAPVTPFQQNCSIVWCDETMEGTAVDPGGDFDMLKQAIGQQGIKVPDLQRFRPFPRQLSGQQITHIQDKLFF